MATSVIETQNLTKVYRSGRRETVALSNLSLEIKQGEIFGYLGPNGAGKTTTIRLLLDLIRPTSGSARVLGMDVREDAQRIHQTVGFMPGELNLWKGRTGKQTIRYLANVRGNVDAQIQEAQRIAERLDLDLTKKVQEYSTGNRRKLGLVLALMHKPELLILDEPTSGLDPLMQQIFNQMMREVRDEGRTVFLSSHVLSEVQAICDRVGILRDGKLQAVENVEKLTRVDFRIVEVLFKDVPENGLVKSIEAIEGVSEVEARNHHVRFKLLGDFDPVLRAASDGYIKDIHVEEPTLEEIFLSFYGSANGKVQK